MQMGQQLRVGRSEKAGGRTMLKGGRGVGRVVAVPPECGKEGKEARAGILLLVSGANSRMSTSE